MPSPLLPLSALLSFGLLDYDAFDGAPPDAAETRDDGDSADEDGAGGGTAGLGANDAAGSDPDAVTERGDEDDDGEDDDGEADDPAVTSAAEASAPSGDGEVPEGEVTASKAAAEGATDPEDLDLEDIFGDPEELEIEELDQSGSGGGQKAPPSKWENLDLRLRVVSSIYMDVDGPDGSYDARRFQPGFNGRGNFSRHETRIELYAAYTPNEHISIVADFEPVFLKFPEPADLGELTDRFQLAPFHVESDAAYVHVIDALPGLDFKFGRQIIVWGTADKFNPTNNLNPDDLEDRPLFTEPIANQMAVVDFNPWSDKLWFQGVYVPWFVPALLPPSATVALADAQAKPPYVQRDEEEAIEFLQNFIRLNPDFDPAIFTNVNSPNRKFTNGQAAFKIGSSLGPVDMSASYYYGFHDIPLPVNVDSEQIGDIQAQQPDPETGRYYRSDVDIIYPRMHVWGLDFATQLGFLDNAGLWGEGALILPAQQYRLRTELPVSLNVPNYEDEDGGLVEVVNGPLVNGRGGKPLPFLKATVGADYTIGKHIYIQAQYLRGMIDQFGGGNIGNFLVGGTDLVFFGRHLVFRTFAVTEFPEIGEKGDVPSVAIAPDLIVVPPWGFITFELGGFALIGRRDTYFGAPYTGSSIVYFKATGQF